MKFNITLLLLFLTSNFLFAQAVIELKNPSFEGFQRAGQIGGRMPVGWYDCGFPGESVPDVLPIPGDVFEVTNAPADGESYLGMVVRENNTWEAISQRLPEKLQKDKCYYFSLMLARSLLYKSANRQNPDSVVNYVTPVKIRIWGGNGFCNKAFLLAESSMIINSRWLKFDFNFKPDEDYNYIMIEAFYKTPTLFPYNGNVLLDDASAIYEISCEEAGPMIDSLKQKLAKESLEKDRSSRLKNNQSRTKKLNNPNAEVKTFAEENWSEVLFKEGAAELTKEGTKIFTTILSKYKYQSSQNPITVRLDFEKGELSKKRMKVIKKIFSEYYYKEGYSVKLLDFAELDEKWDYKNEHLWMTLRPKD